MIKEKFTPNPLQQECIDNTEGKYLVLAGPGTGKTFTLIQRIASMLKKGIKGEKILCLTFSDAAANEMKTRLARELNKLETGVSVFTYHSFCNEIINTFAQDFKLSQDIKPISQTLSRQFIKECIDEINPVEYRSSKNDPYVFLETILSQIEQIKKNRLDKEKYFKNIEQNPDWKPKIALLEEKLEEYKLKGKKIPKYLPDSIETQKKKIQKAFEIWDFYELYTKKMQSNHYLDFNDMINLVLDKFELEPSFLNEIANKYDYILVDEYQDTNKNQNEIVFNLVDSIKTKNVFVVGDDDQIIYTFQGARLDTIEKFLLKFPDTKVICLKENMRSNKEILQTARALIKQDSRRLEINPNFSQYQITKELVAKNENIKNVSVQLTKYFDTKQEYNSIVSQIENLINSSDCPSNKEGKKDLSQIAILTKNNKEAAVFSQMLKDRNIPYELKEGKNIFEIKSSIVLYNYLKMLVNPDFNSDSVFKLLLLEPFNINPLDYVKLQEKSSNNKSFIKTMKDRKDFIEQDKIDNFINTFEYLNKFQTNETLRDIVVEVGAKTGIFDYYLNSEINKNENILGLKKLIDTAIEYSDNYKKFSLAEFIEYLDIVQIDNIEIKTDKPPIPLNAVQISTYHSSKGREFEYVYMPTLMRKYWEGDNSSLRDVVPVDASQYKTDDELKEMKYSDKLKLMYVGFTRAKHTLNLSYVENLNNKAENPSEFIVNIQDILDKKDCSQYSIDSCNLECKNSIVKRNYDYKRDFRSYIDSLLEDKYYSPTAINEYLNCPRQYLYNNLLNIKSKHEISDAKNYGTAIHYALEETMQFVKENNSYPDINYAVKKFKNKLSSLPLTSIQQREILETRGENELKSYWGQFCSTPVSNIYVSEYSIKEGQDIYRFFGVIDRIDKNNDGTYSIYDYKTGNPKTIKDVYIGGKYENYYNQIALYKYFFEKQTGKEVKQTGIIFVQDCTKNLALNLTKEESNAVFEKFKNAIDKIRAYEFEPSYKKEACRYCTYKDFCSMDII